MLDFPELHRPLPVRYDGRIARSLFFAAYVRVRSAVLKSPPSMTVPEWADKYRHLALSAGAVGGRWRTSRVEVARGPMMAITEPGVQTITLMVATQTLKTSLLENAIGYVAHLDPAPILLTQPKDESVGAFSKERLVPMVKATPVLKNLIGDYRVHKGGGKADDTIRLKQFPGGLLAMASAGSPSNLAMRAIRFVFEDEIDKYETTKEGDPLQLAEERTATFPTNKLIIRACSPTWEETSRIYRSYQSSDQRRPFVKCPHCDHEQTLEFFKHVHWEKNEDESHKPETAVIKCEACSKPWTEQQRQALIGTENKIRWFQTREFTCCGVHQKPLIERNWKWSKKYQVGYAYCRECGERAVPNMHAGFTASKLYSPFITVVELATKWIDAKDDPETKQTFYNTQLGLPFKVDAMKEVAADGLSGRAEDYMTIKTDRATGEVTTILKDGTLPRQVLILTAGVDVQAGGSANLGRLEVEVTGWGLGEESWLIAKEIFEGNPAEPEVWDELEAFLARGYRHPTGHILRVAATCVDSGGHNTQDVYSFCRARANSNVWAIKGATDKGNQWSPIWPGRSTEQKKKYRTGFRPIILGVNAAKEAIRQRLLVETPGAGYCHFPVGLPTSHYDQLTSERLVLEKKAGHTARRWVLPKGRANEALDCRVYSYSALWGLRHVRRLTLERQFELLEVAPPRAGGDDAVDADKKTVQALRKRKVHRSSFMR